MRTFPFSSVLGMDCIHAGLIRIDFQSYTTPQVKIRRPQWTKIGMGRVVCDIIGPDAVKFAPVRVNSIREDVLDICSLVSPQLSRLVWLTKKDRILQTAQLSWYKPQTTAR